MMKLTSLLVLLLLGLATACSRNEAPTHPPQPVRILSSNGVKAVVEALQPQIEQAISRPLDIEFSTATGLKQRIEQGAAFDVAILTPAMIDDLASHHHIVAESKADIARTGVGIGAREGAPRADVTTAEALKTLLLNAKSVAFTEAGQSRSIIDATCKQLGIEEAMKAKTILKGPGESPEAVARGEAELVLTLISEIVPVKGIQLLGPLPAELQGYVSFAGGRNPMARDAAAADTVLRYLSGPAAESALKTNGMEAVR